MERTVKDAAHILQAIVGEDHYDNYTSAIPSIPDYATAREMYALRGARVGVPWNVIELTAVKETAVEVGTFKKAIGVLKSASAVSAEAKFTKAREHIESDYEVTVLNADFVSNLALYLAELASNPNHIVALAYGFEQHNEARGRVKSYVVPSAEVGDYARLYAIKQVGADFDARVGAAAWRVRRRNGTWLERGGARWSCRFMLSR